MKMLICLHGNPLQGQEFDPIASSLEKAGYQPIIHKRPLKGCLHLEPLIQSINATAKVSGGGTFGLVAYSWGAYLALSYLRRFPENVTGVLLINPLLVDKKPPSLCSRLLLSTPLLRTFILKLKCRKMAMDYIDKTFFPEKPSEEIRTSLYAFLAQGAVWRGAAAYKKLMITTPLPNDFPSLQIPIQVLFGEKDEVAPKLEQIQLLQTLNNLHLITLPSAGHALPWTHAQYVIQEIKSMIPS
jgi:pimeloyl-ACP methyl ester carboxylesterase